MKNYLIPDILQIDISPYCNLNCNYCDNVNGKKCNKYFIDVDNFKFILNQAEEIKHVIPQFWGEPLLHPNFEELLFLCKEKEKYVSYYTNGTTLHNFNIKKILTYSDEIKISIESIDEEHYYSIKREPLFNQVKDNIIRLWQENKKMGFPTNIIIRATNIFENDKEIEMFRKYWEPFCHKLIIKPLRNLTKDYFLFNIPKGFYCEKLHKHSIVKFNGDMITCCSDHFGEIVIGNVFKNNIVELFNSDSFSHLRNNLHQNKFCNNCWYLYKI